MLANEYAVRTHTNMRTREGLRRTNVAVIAEAQAFAGPTLFAFFTAISPTLFSSPSIDRSVSASHSAT
jgi:hypothetical protein